MDDFLNWIASLKGITVEDGEELRFEFLSFPSGGMALLVILGLVAALGVVVLVYRRDGKNLGMGKRLFLATLRALAIMLAAFLLLEPALVAVKKETRPGRTILLVDTSQSMAQVDAFRRDDVGDLIEAWRQLGIENPGEVDRLTLTRAILGYENQELVRRLAQKNELKVYGFDGDIEPLPATQPEPELGPDGEPVEEPGVLPSAPTLLVDQIDAPGRYSNLGGAVRAALDKSRGSEVAGIVLITDGRRNAGPQGAEVARILGQRKVPVTLVLGVGDPSETQTVSITRLDAPEKVFQRDPFEIKAQVASQGYDAVSVVARLVRIDEEGVEQQIGQKQVALGGSEPESLVVFDDLKSDETGPFTYKITIDPPDGEPAKPVRHEKQARVEVLGEQTRVLLVAGGSNFEYRVLKNQLKRDKTIEVSCWLQSADEDFPQEGDPGVEIKELPKDRDALEPYDVVIFLDPNSDKLTRTWCDMVAQHVVENGCGLWWISGEKFTLKALRDGASTVPLVELLPVIADLEFAEIRIYSLGLGFPKPFPYRLTPDGAEGIGTKITRIDENRDRSKLLWGQLPGYHLAFPVKRLKPAATALVENTSPDFRMDDGRQQPVLATQFMGAARVLWSGVDETYRWRAVNEDAYDRFWVKGIRYLFEGRLNAGNSKFKLILGTEKIELGESIKIVAQAKNDAYRPLITEDIEVVLARGNEDLDTIKLMPVEEVPGQYEATYRPQDRGIYEIVNTAHKDVTATFEVVQVAFEKEGPVDLSELADISGVDGGVLVRTPQELLEGLDRIPSRTTTDTYRTPYGIWDSWVTLALIVTLLAMEWWFRKRFNLL